MPFFYNEILLIIVFAEQYVPKIRILGTRNLTKNNIEDDLN